MRISPQVVPPNFRQIFRKASEKTTDRDRYYEIAVRNVCEQLGMATEGLTTVGSTKSDAYKALLRSILADKKFPETMTIEMLDQEWESARQKDGHS